MTGEDIDFTKKSHKFKCTKCEEPFHITAHFGKDWTIDGFVLVCGCGRRSDVLPNEENAYYKLVTSDDIEKEPV